MIDIGLAGGLFQSTKSIRGWYLPSACLLGGAETLLLGTARARKGRDPSSPYVLPPFPYHSCIDLPKNLGAWTCQLAEVKMPGAGFICIELINMMARSWWLFSGPFSLRNCGDCFYLLPFVSIQWLPSMWPFVPVEFYFLPWTCVLLTTNRQGLTHIKRSSVCTGLSTLSFFCWHWTWDSFFVFFLSFVWHVGMLYGSTHNSVLFYSCRKCLRHGAILIVYEILC